jgi:hypothetical protein
MTQKYGADAYRAGLTKSAGVDEFVVTAIISACPGRGILTIRLASRLTENPLSVASIG